MNNSAELAGKRVLVTGGSGFIGRPLLDRLAQLNCHRYAVSRAPQAQRFGDIHWHQGDLAESATAQAVIRAAKPDVIFHLASHVVGTRDIEAVDTTFKCNLMSTVNLLTAATETGCSRFILAGSQEEPVPGDSDLVPCSPYAAAKWAGGAYARMFHALYQLPIVILRLFMVYGPAQADQRKLVPYTIQSMLRKEPPQLTSGTRPIDWVYIDDVVDSFLASAEAPHVEGQTIDIGSGRLITVREVVEKLSRITGSRIPPQFGAKTDRAFEQVRAADTHLAKELLAWTAQVSLDEGLQRTVNWYAAQSGSGKPNRRPGRMTSPASSLSDVRR
jgi:nucleoside-diphosphate-sugar epimerase